MKKMSNSFFGICTAGLLATLALLALPRFTSWGSDSQPAVSVSSTPINRDPRAGNSYSAIVKKAAPSVVNIYSSRVIKYRNPMMADPFFRQFFGGQLQGNGGEYSRRENWLGSGIIVTADGYILTANHVVENADEIKVGISNDKTEYSARVIGTDPATDIAVLKIQARDLPAITLGDSSQLEVGDVVLAVGNPFGLGQTVTRGIISALGRTLPDMDDGDGQFDPGNNRIIRRYQDFIQTDASINKGNSGGALVDAEGRLIGINDAIVSPSGTSAGIGFAVPINLARSVMEGFLNRGHLARGYLGINPQDVDAGLALSFGVANSGGALIADVGPNSPADKAGLKSGDVIIAINNQEITSADKLRVTVAQLAPGTKATVKFIRDGVEKRVEATLGELPGGNPVAEIQDDANSDLAKADMLDGVEVGDLDDQARQLLQAAPGLNGAIVTKVSPESNAARAGLRPNDIIVEVNRQPVNNGEDAVRLGKASRNTQILVKVWRHRGAFVGTRYLSVDNTKRTK